MRATVRLAASLLCLVAALVSATGAAQGYPTRPIRFIAPFPPGGSSDVLCRLLGQKLTERLGQPVTVENRPGAGGNIGHEFAAKQVPDGYTILISSSSTLATNPHLYKHLGFDPIADFAPISMVASAGQVLVVNPSVPAKSVEVREKYDGLGVQTEHSTPEEVTARIKADTLEVAKVLAAAGVEPE
ncbi:MAG TPA: tripartite tricarboxylate transporter substrate binding protein [Burkholderiales bacterium]|nr:tripartite tricarboxylate transporter substrate binding protein [Burkholderiales bacterium]